jgi:hypothetical protein
LDVENLAEEVGGTVELFLWIAYVVSNLPTLR